MKPSLSRPAVKIVFVLFFVRFYRHRTTTHTCLALVLDHCGGVYAANNQTPKSVTLLSAQRSWFKSNNGINGRGPPEAGRMPFMPAVRLNQRSGGATRSEIRFSAMAFLRFASSFSCLRLFCSSIFWPSQRLLSVREQCARFKLLSAGAGSKHGDLCNEQIRDSNERSNLSCGFCSPKRHFRRAPLLPKNSSAD
ncbi:MAG: hypothetical protein QOG55_3473 [Acidobacteriaceae bacterium]|jgi:hypothetical protein|nr:hypothetical protein [Acidobacteriaceae bacterium]